MDVSEILNNLGTLSIGLDEPDEGDISVFLRFINLAYVQLLQATASENPLIVKLHEKLDCTNGVLSSTSHPIFIPKSVYNIATNVAMTGTIEEDIIEYDPAIKKTGNPQQWYYSNGVINTYPLSTSTVANGGGFGIRYIAEPKPLTALSLSSDILIPKLYQQVLLDGASYYVFQSETGFKDQTKMAEAKAKWEDGKKQLFSYMKNISGKKHYSTYSPV
jgi:hypothetical protein